MCFFEGPKCNTSIKQMPSTGPHQPDGIDGAGRQLHERKLLQSGLSNVAQLVETQS